MKILGVIPARYASTRFPGKPLTLINGKSMINRVYDQALQSKELTRLVVATDDDRIFEHVKAFGGDVVMTGGQHATGTDRCAEVLNLYSEENFEVVINIQGDEPYIQPEQISLLASCFLEKNTQLATLRKHLESTDELFSPTVIKLLIDKSENALYFSRQALPFLRSVEDHKKWVTHHRYYKHIGIYAYRSETLNAICKLPLGILEQAESLEQLRWMENGYNIKTIETSHESHSVDVPEDVMKFNGWE